MQPGTHLHQRFIYSLASKDKVGMKAAAEKVAAWDFGACCSFDLARASVGLWEEGDSLSMVPCTVVAQARSAQH